MYIVSVDGISGDTGDSVYVYSPTGEATGYKIDGHTPAHYKQLNVILNSVIDKGYKLMEVVITNLHGYDEIYYFTKPWISSSSELDEANTSQLNITGFPNPTTGMINIKISYTKGYEPKEIVVINEGGFIIYTKQLEHIESGETITLDLSNQKTGLYLITAKNSVHYSALIKMIRN
jgi:hypothetical protein